MENQANERDRQIPLNIPWLRLWEKKAERTQTPLAADRQTRLFNIDYMAMLEELEFK